MAVFYTSEHHLKVDLLQSAEPDCTVFTVVFIPISVLMILDTSGHLSPPPVALFKC